MSPGKEEKTCLKAVSVFLASLFWHGHFHVALKLHKLTEIASLVITIQLHLITSFCLPKASTLNPIPLVWPPPSSWSSEFIVKFLVVLCTRWLIPVLRKYSNLGLHHLGSKHISPFQDDWMMNPSNLSEVMSFANSPQQGKHPAGANQFTNASMNTKGLPRFPNQPLLGVQGWQGSHEPRDG